jgi:hypothetical protein
MLGTSDVGSESVTADVQLDASKTGLLSPCGSDRLAVPVVIVFFGAIIFQNPAGHEYTCCLSTSQTYLGNGYICSALRCPFCRRNIRTDHGTSSGMPHVYSRRMPVCSPQLMVARVALPSRESNEYTRFIITPRLSPFRQWLRSTIVEQKEKCPEALNIKFTASTYRLTLIM